MRIFTLCLYLLIGTVLLGQPLELSLDQAQQKALELNRNAQISKLEIEKAKYIVKETLAIGLPQVNAEGSFQNFLDIPTTVLPDFISPTVYQVLIDEELVPEGSGGQPGLVPAQFGTEYNVSGGVSLSQLIFNGSYLIGLQAAKTYLELSKVQDLKTTMEVKEAVTMAYTTALIAKENTPVLRDSQEKLREMLTEIEALYAEGFVEEQDVQQMRLTLNTLSSQVRNAERQEELTMQLLKFQIGIGLDQSIALSDDINSLAAQMDVSSLLADAVPTVEDHPDRVATQTNIDIQRLRLREQRSRYLPVLSGFVSHSQQAQRNEFDFFEGGGEWFPNTVWGINLQVPVFSSGMKASAVKQREVDLKQAEIMDDQTREALQISAIQSRSEYLYALDSYETAVENLDIAISIR
ncbi:MAG: TolC family protein, partial [Flavobacteriales bacterium]|nr:TolC family protein [Flavobacteriales bacterium]